MDILKRFNKQLGNEIYIATGTDSYESHVIPEALRNSCTIEETCLTNKKCIQISLEKLSIDVDLFINPSDNKIKDDYTSFLVRMHTKLIKSNFTCKIEHLVPYNSNTKNYITGSSLIGKCPECNNNGSGYYCEVCGMDNPADTLKSSYDKYHPKDQLALVKTDDYYLILDKKHIIDSAKKKSLGRDTLRLAYKYILKNDYARLTELGSWGIKDATLNNEHVIYSYSSSYFYSLFLGELLKIEFSLEKNPFEHNSKFEIIFSFGFDNTIPLLIYPPMFSKILGEYKDYSHCLVNRFYHLNNSKFSTSRRNVIWARDCVETLGSSVDIIRLYLCHTCPDENTSTNFDENEFKCFSKNISIIFNKIYSFGEYNKNDADIPALDMYNYFFENYIDLSPGCLNLKKVADRVISLLNVINVNDRNQIIFLSAFIYPICPSFAQKLWTKLNLNGQPRYLDIKK
ncbi:hypothetical protein SY86_09180 [Erwinia tracheiphila]|nr:hypothetical protein SY86_09180 [Erwinia tracheiphila]